VSTDDGVFIHLTALVETDQIGSGTRIWGFAHVMAGVTIGRYALVGAGTVVTKDVPDFELVVGNPDRSIGSVCRCGQCLTFTPHRAVRTCGHRFRRTDDQRIEEEEP
jgi:UDP-2-acetamido-3-amino-2,3-dideoxy-glucuronate N-acetyltransferase